MTTKKLKVDRKSSESLAFLESLTGPITFGSMMLSIRKSEDWTQAEMARMLEISDKHLSDIENERRSVSPSRAAQWASDLGYSQVTFVELALQNLLDKEGIDFKVSLKSG